MKLAQLSLIILFTAQTNASTMKPETYERIKATNMVNSENMQITDGFGNPLTTPTGDQVATFVPSQSPMIVAEPSSLIESIKAPEMAPIVKKETYRTLDVPFATDSKKVNQQWKAQLKKFISSLKGKNFSKIELTGFSDPRGNINYNEALSQKRAKAVQEILTAHGMSADQLEVIGAGVRENTTHSAARVVEVRVLQ